jgi:hypothetical protein
MAAEGLQVRCHEICGPTEYHTLCRLSGAEAREVIRAGKPFWRFGDPDRPEPSNAIPKVE